MTRSSAASTTSRATTTPGATATPGCSRDSCCTASTPRLFFANADSFRARVAALARSGDVRWVVVAAEPITDVDTTAGEMLRTLDDELTANGEDRLR